MNRAVIIALVILTVMLLTGNTAQAQIPQPFLPLPQQSVATTDDALSTLVNPAGLGIRTGGSFYLLAPYLTDGDFGDWGYAFGGDGMGFVGEYIRNEIENDVSKPEYNPRRNRYTWGFGFGDEGVYFGAAYSWTKGLDRQNSWDIGMMVRPYNFASFGAVARGVNNPRIGARSQNVGWDLGLAFRPLALLGPIGWDKGHRLTITADAYMREFDEILNSQEEETYGDNIGFKFGASMEIVPGVIGHIDYLTAIDGGVLERDDQLSGGMTFCFDHSEIGAYQREGGGAGSSWIAFRELNRRSLLVKPDKKFVEIKLNGPIVEYQQWISFFNTHRYRSVHSFTTMLEEYAEDPSVAGILLKIEGFGAGFGKTQEMREAIVRFRQSGKQVIVYMEGTGNRGYYLASAADKIYLAPTSGVELTGMAASMMFLRGTLDKIGINPELEHIGDYKSASDMLTRRDMSDAQREATDAILDDLFNCMVEGIADGRDMTPDEVRQLIDEGPFTSQEAYDAHLVDSLVYVDQLSDLVQALDTTKKKPSVVGESGFNMQRRMARLDWDDSRRKTIAIVYALGSITSGESSGGGLFGGGSMGSETIVQAIRQARGDDDVAAIVFRIDSPGGSGLASEMILREVALTSDTTGGKKTKPFIASMSDVAGSGGYYIACKADEIYADPGTITGSIGVISGKFSYAGLYNKIDLNTATLRRGLHADMYSGDRSFTEEEREQLCDQINQFYQLFLQNVADGRGMDTAAVNEVAQGRIWSGIAAKNLNLIDEIGGLREAILRAAELAGIEEGEAFTIKMYPSSSGSSIMMEGMQSIVRAAIPEEIIRLADTISDETRWEDGELLMIMPYQLNIE